MKLKIILLVLFASILTLVPSVYAHSWDRTAINSGYAVTTDWHGIDVPIATPVTARAGTTDPSIVEVKFRWLYPDGTEKIVVPTSLDHTDTWNGQTIYVFMDTQIPDVLGDWGVQAIFYDGEGHGRGPIPTQPEKVSIKATSFNVVPEVPLGTVVILIAMLGALSVFAIKKKHIISIR